MNLNQYFLQKFVTYDQRIALEYVKDGVIQSLTYRDLKSKALRVVNFLYGLEPNDRTLIWSKNRVEWIWTNLGVLLSGGINSSIHPEATEQEAIHILKDLDPKFIFVENQEQLDILAKIKDQIPSFEKVLVYDEVTQREDWIAPFSWLFDFKTRPEAAGTIHKIADLSTEDDVSTILYTKGRTGLPKGVQLSHQNILSSLESLTIRFEKKLPGMMRQLCVSSLSRVMPNIVDMYFTLASGRTLVLPEQEVSLQKSVPNVLFGDPTYFEQLQQQIMNQFKTKKKFDWAIDISKQVQTLLSEKKSVPSMLRIKYNLAKKLIINKIQKTFGDHLRFVVSGGGILSYETAEFLRACGLPLIIAFASTETCGIVFGCSLRTKEFSCKGKIYPTLEARISDNGKLEIKGNSISKGYLNNKKQTIANFTKDGFFKTGDAAQITSDNRIELLD